MNTVEKPYKGIANVLSHLTYVNGRVDPSQHLSLSKATYRRSLLRMSELVSGKAMVLQIRALVAGFATYTSYNIGARVR